MRKKLALLVLLLIAITPTLSDGSVGRTGGPAAKPGRCPKGSHLVSCPTGDFCCPDNALCVCFP